MTWLKVAIMVQQLAHAVAKFAKPAALSESRAAAIPRLQEAITREPFYSSGYGIALQIADGNSRASSVAMLALPDYLGVLSESQKISLQVHITPQILNSRGPVVGEIHPAHAWLHE